MTTTPKTTRRAPRDLAALLALGGLALLALILTLQSGCTHPSALERRLYTIETNQIPVSVTTNTAVDPTELATNYAPLYKLTPKPETAELLAGAGIFGPTGELVAGILGLALLTWAQIRNARARKMAEVLAQGIETGRAMLQGFPTGEKLDRAWRSYMKSSQLAAGIHQDVQKVLLTVDPGLAYADAKKVQVDAL